MNKQKIKREFAKKGISIISIEFSEEGHRLQLMLNPSKNKGWEEFEDYPIEGFEVVSSREISEYEKRVTFVPASEVEFTYYIQKYVNCYGLSRKTAVVELKRIVNNTNSIDAISALEHYNNKYDLKK